MRRVPINKPGKALLFVALKGLYFNQHAILDGTKAPACHDNWLDRLPPETAPRNVKPFRCKKDIGSFGYTARPSFFPRAVARETDRWTTGVSPKPRMPSDLQSRNCRPNFS
jgi:hypothetical protein